MILLLALALADEPVGPAPPPEPETVEIAAADYRRYVTESRQLEACRAREEKHLDALARSRAAGLALHDDVTRCLQAGREADAALVAEVDALTDALERSERRRGRLRTAAVAGVAAVAGAVLGAAVRGR